MIVLDTNVISALMRTEPDPAVVGWLDGLPPESVWTTSVTVFEIRMGLEILAPGRRRRHLRDVQIAGIVHVRRASLATRNTRHFEGCGLALVDPWSM